MVATTDYYYTSSLGASNYFYRIIGCGTVYLHIILIMNIAVFVSGDGTNLQAIIDAAARGEISAKVALVVCNNQNAYALTRAKNAGIKTFILDHRKFNSREEYDREIIKELEKNDINLIVLAGFMRLLSPYFISKYRNKILNVHPALLPQFKGTHGIRDAFDSGAKETGVTVHFVDEELDHGPIILQEKTKIKETDTLETLEERIHKIEHVLYPVAIKLFVEGKIKI